MPFGQLAFWAHSNSSEVNSVSSKRAAIHDAVPYSSASSIAGDLTENVKVSTGEEKQSFVLNESVGKHAVLDPRDFISFPTELLLQAP